MISLYRLCLSALSKLRLHLIPQPDSITAELFDVDLTCACKVDALRTAGNPRNVLSVQIVQVRYSCGTCSLVMMR